MSQVVSNNALSSNPDYPVKVTETVDGQVQHVNVDDTPGKLSMSENREGIETSGVFGWIREGSDLSEAGTTNTVIVATGHNVRKGDYLRFLNGATIGHNEYVLSTTTNSITMVGPVNGLTGSGFGFEILRKDALVLGANNTLNVSGSVNLVDTSSNAGALWYPDGNGQASLAVTLFDEINTVPYGASNPIPVGGTLPISTSRKFVETGGLHGYDYLGVSTVQAGSTNTTINVTSITSPVFIKRGDYVRLLNASGSPSSNPVEYVVSTTSTSFTVANAFSGTVSVGQQFEVMRPVPIYVDSANGLKIGGSININASTGYPLIDFNDGGGQAALPVTLFDPNFNGQIGNDSNPLVIKGGGIPTPTTLQQLEVNPINGWSYKGVFIAGVGSGGDTIFNASTIFRVGDLVKVITGLSTDKYTYISSLNSGFFNVYTNLGVFSAGDRFEIWRKEVVGVDSEHNLQTTAMVTNIGESLKTLTRLIAKPVWVSQASGEVRTSTVVSSGALTTVTTVTTVNQVAGFDARATQLFDASRTSWGSNIRGRIT
jgi:hypothetical protein